MSGCHDLPAVQLNGTSFVYCASCSLTLQRRIGLKFAKDSGLVLKVGQYQDKDGVIKFECEIFSCFPEERETLFFGGDTTLWIKAILQWAMGKWRHYDKYMEPINAFSRMVNGLSIAGQPITSKKSSQMAMRSILADVLRALIWQREAKTPKYIKNMVLYHHSRASRVRLLYDELMSSYQWLGCILKSESGDVVNFANIAVLFCHSDDITFMMPEGMEFTDGECSMFINDMVSISQMALDVNIRLLWPSTMPQTNKSRFTNASVGLYGANCQRYFDSKSISFTTAGVTYSVEAQTLFEACIQKLIQCLSVVAAPEKAKSVTKQIASS